eukprot:3154020-Prymnesium_polylepis.2
MPSSPDLHGASAIPVQPEPVFLNASGQRRTSGHAVDCDASSAAVAPGNGAWLACGGIEVVTIKAAAAIACSDRALATAHSCRVGAARDTCGALARAILERDAQVSEAVHRTRVADTRTAPKAWSTSPL